MSRKFKLFISLMLMLTLVGAKPSVDTLAETRAAGVNQGDVIYKFNFNYVGKWYVRVVVRDKSTKEKVDKLKVNAIYYNSKTNGDVVRIEEHWTDNSLNTYNLQIEANAFTEDIQRVDLVLAEDLDKVVETGSASTGPVTPIGIQYDADGGVFKSGSSFNKVKSYYNEKIDIYDDYEEPTKSGAEFLGWNSSNDQPWDMDRLLQKGDAPFTALWDYQKYVVTFDYQDERNPLIIEEIQHGSLIEEPKLDEKLGYEFLGWYKDKELTKQWNFSNDHVESDLTLYAGWKELKYSVTFETDGGTPIDPILEIKHGSTLVEPDEPFKDGYGFGGWFKESQNVNEWNFETDTVIKDTILYSKWNEKIYTVEFETNGGSNIKDANDIHHGQTVSKPKNPTKEGYNFKGWYVDEDLTNEWNFKNPVTSDMTLYAKWEIKLYTVKYQTNGAENIADEKNIEHGSLLLEPDEPFRDGFGFGGWYKESSLKTEWNFDQDVVTKNMTLYAKWNEKIYTVDFETNGGTPMDDIEDIHHGTVIQINQETKRENYTFVGWYVDESLNDVWDPTLPIENDTTLYAKWELNKYKVNFEGNGGTNTPSQIEVEYGTLVSRPSDPEKENYSFNGWFLDPKFEEEWDFLTPITQDITLYAKWSLNQYTVIFDSDGGTDIPLVERIEHGSLLIEPEEPFREEYGFSGWFTDKDYLTEWDFLHDRVESNMTLYAKWNHNEYTVDFVSDGQLISETSEIKHGETVPKPSDPEKEGYTFKGWYQDEAGLNDWDFDRDVVTNDMTLYAKWEINQYTVIFESNGGSVVETQTVIFDTPIEKPETSFVGHTLKAWYSDKNLTQEWDFSNPVKENLTLYAKWEINQYKVTFNTDSPNVIDDVIVVHGEKLTQPSDPIKEHYSFVGWYTDDTLQTEWDFSQKIIEDTTLFAKWDIDRFTITFETNGGNLMDPMKNIPYGSKPNEPEEPFRDGYGFAGWYQDANLSVPFYFGVHPVERDLTLYAGWNEKIYTVEFESNGGSFVDDFINVHHDSLIDKPDDPTRLGYSFIGWYQDVELTQAWDFENSRVTNDLTLYASWDNLQLVVGFNSMGGSKVPILTKIPAGSLIEEPEAPTLAGYGFGGWYRGPWESEAWDFANDTVEDNMILYAHWNESLYTVEFESNGGSLVEDISFVHAGDTINKPNDPSKEGFSFIGWFVDEDLKTLWNFETNTVSGDTILYAGWLEDTITFNVYFDSNGGSTISPILNIEKDSLLTEPSSPEKDGYTFTGWYKDDQLSEVWNFEHDRVTEETTLYAGWLEDTITFNVYFDSNGGSTISPILNIEKDSLLAEPNTPMREGYIFIAWYKDPTLKEQWDFNKDRINGDLTLFASWLLDEEDKPEEKPDEETGVEGNEQKPETKPLENEDLPATGMGYSQAIIGGALIAIVGLILLIFGKRNKNK